MLLFMLTLLVIAIMAVPALVLLIGIGGPVLLVFGELFVFVYIIVRIVKAIVKKLKN